MKKMALVVLVTIFSPQAWADVITLNQSDPLSPFQDKFAPLVFEKYHGPETLVGVTLTETASIKNDFLITFANSATITLSVEESIFGFKPITISRGATSSGAETIVPPGVVTPFSRTLTLDPKSFVGTGSYVIPVDAAAMSHFSSSDGNGYGAVRTYGQVDAILTYQFAPNPTPSVHPPVAVPEPSTHLLAAIMGLSAAVSVWWRTKRRIAVGKDVFRVEDPV
jgi:hypothetical protein